MIYFTSDLHFYHTKIKNHSRQFLYGSYHLHGHLHGTKYDNIKNLKAGIRRYDVGVDANNFFLVSIDDIILFFEETNP